ncbi:hypothetical protein GWK47_017248 [Chionoecetes opilio]|uniref:Uncharacterized protein n=1 Tax=Chionoecetes opilio TaxID=41210 RepID=A0A8J5CHA2_CHIOP|nr:hypothetical protein GWK47_017248 [Chionoecetes opilio]
MLFHDQLGMSRRELAGIRRVAFFLTMVYAKYRERGNDSVPRTKNDLDFITDVKRVCDDGLRRAGKMPCGAISDTFPRTRSGLAFFDDRISPEQKAEMVEGMKRPFDDQESTAPRVEGHQSISTGRFPPSAQCGRCRS